MSYAGPAVLAIFCLAYALVFAEEKLQLRKSKPVMLAGGLIWIVVAIGLAQAGRGGEVATELRKVVLEYAELLLFLLSAMSFVNALIERRVFDALRARLGSANVTVRGIFWITGSAAFLLSPVADNLTTALVMGSVAASALGHRRQALLAAMVSIVVAANAGGAFSPFGDITTLMVWQSGKVDFFEFFALFVPSLLNWLLPAFIMSLFLPAEELPTQVERVRMRHGGVPIALLFLCTIALTVYLDHSLHLPPFLGMMLGLAVLNFYGYFLYRWESRKSDKGEPFNIFRIFGRIEWDTLLFFYGIMLCVGGLAAVGYLAGLSGVLYNGLGPTAANISIGIVSAVVDNIPLTYAVLLMNPAMDHGQWLLVTLTAGVGGSLLSVGSAAGVALMGLARGSYTFLGHLRWAWAVLLGYAAAVAAHLLLNAQLLGP